MAFSVLFFSSFPRNFYHVVCSVDGCWMPRWHFHGSASHIPQGYHSWMALVSSESVILYVEMALFFFSMYIALYLPRWKFTCHLFAQSLLLENPSTVLQSALILSSVYPDTFSTSFIQIHLQSLILLAPELFSTLTSVPGTEGLSRESYPGLGLPLPASEQHCLCRKEWPCLTSSGLLQKGWMDGMTVFVCMSCSC